MYNTKEGKSCVIYIRVSSERQVKGYSLDGQKHYLAECAERRGMTVLDTYVEEGKSGKSIEGRTEFQRMLDDIQSGKVHTDYVLVFKLSRFGRNARDVLNSLEFIMKYGVHLMCVEDGLDSSTSMGKMMITILGAVAELERENIIAQSLLGREEKAKSGGWNGGFAPYGYRLVKGDDKSKGKLETVPEEKAVVQLVFDMFLNRNMGYTAISGYLNRNGYTRPPAKNIRSRILPCHLHDHDVSGLRSQNARGKRAQRETAGGCVSRETLVTMTQDKRTNVSRETSSVKRSPFDSELISSRVGTGRRSSPTGYAQWGYRQESVSVLGV